jgi:hypothetical protein
VEYPAAAEPQHSSRRISHVGMPLSKRSPLSDGQNDDSHCCCLGALQARGQFYSKLKVRDHVTSLAAFSTELADQARPTRAWTPSIFRYIHSAACGRAVDILRCHRPRLRAPYHWPIGQPPLFWFARFGHGPLIPRIPGGPLSLRLPAAQDVTWKRGKFR